MTIHWSSTALARTIGTTNPAEIEAYAALISDGDFVLQFSNTNDPYSDDEPIVEFTNAQNEIGRLLSTHLPHPSPNNSSAVGGPLGGHHAASRGLKHRRAK